MSESKVAPTGPTNADVMIVGEAPGADEERLGRAFVGASGALLDKWLAACGQRRDAVWVGNVCNYRPPQNKLASSTHAWITTGAAAAKRFGCKFAEGGMYFNAAVAEGLIELHEAIERQQPRLIVALGNTPLWALAGKTGVAAWRGSELWYERGGLRIPLIPTFHPAYVLRVWEWNAMVLHDLRTRAFGKMTTPAAREAPEYRFVITPTCHDVTNWFADRIIGPEPRPLACDIEGWGKVDCIGFAAGATDAICIPLTRADGSQYWSETDWTTVRSMLDCALRSPCLVGQNFNYDAQCIETTLGVLPRVWFDTMAAQHVMLPGTPKDLAYLSSMYRRHHVYWKDDLPEATAALDDEAKGRYNCLTGDTLVLKADLTWAPLQDISVGDDLLSFEEQHSGFRYGRKLKLSRVTRHRRIYGRRVVRVVLDNGTSLCGTPDHVVFINPYGQRQTGIWRTFENLQMGDRVYYVPPWSVDDTFDGGWVAGLLDGEGTLGAHRTEKRMHLIRPSFSQKKGLVLDRACSLLDSRNFDLTSSHKTNAEYVDVNGGLSEYLRLLGTFPTNRLQNTLLTGASTHGWSGFSTLPRATVVRVEELPLKATVYDIATSTRTLIANGVFVHNCLDCVATFEVFERQTEALVKRNLWRKP